MSKLWSQVAQTSGTQLAAILASAATLAITARLLGPEGRGLFAAASTWVGLFALVGSLSLGQVLVHRVAGRHVDEWLPETFGTLLALLAASTLAGWAIAAAAYVATDGAAFGHLPPLLLALAFVAYPLLLAAEPVRYLLMAMDRLHVANVAQLGGAAASVVGVGLFVLILRWGVPGALVAFSLTAGTPVLLGLAHVARRAGRAAFRLDVARGMLKGSAQLHLSAIGTYFFAQASVLVLNHYRTPAEVGHYQLALQLFNLALVGSSAVGAVSFGLVSRAGPDGAWPEQRRLLGQSVALVSLMAAAGYLLAPLGVRVIAGEEFAPVVPIFRLLLPGLVGATLSTVMASQWIGRGLLWQAAGLTILVGMGSLLASILLVPRHGVYGGAAGLLLAYGIGVVGNLLMAARVQASWRRTVPDPA